MKKQEFIETLAIECLCSQLQAGNFLAHLTEMIKDEIEKTGECVVPGIGKFKMVDVPEREHRNPTTGETFMKPAHKKLKFKIAKSMTE